MRVLSLSQSLDRREGLGDDGAGAPFEREKPEWDRLFAGGTVNAAQAGEGPPLFLFHSLLSDRASFDAIAPELARSFTVIVPELPGFGPFAGRGRRACRRR